MSPAPRGVVHLYYPWPQNPGQSLESVDQIREQLAICPPWARRKLRLRWQGRLIAWTEAADLINGGAPA